MIDFNNISNLYFLGIGGIGMSAMARYAAATGKNVAGYDLTATRLTRQLESEGIAVHYEDDINQFPDNFKSINSLVVRTPAVPDSLNELQVLKSRNYQIVKRSELLGFLTGSRFCIAVAGTHGKTSVSTMIAYLLHETGFDMGAFLGGISRNFNSNMVLPLNEESMVVTEADEFDRSFLHLHPSISVLTSLEADHLDIYGSLESLREAFSLFIANTRREGIVLLNKRVNMMHYLPQGVKGYTYSIDDEADFCIRNLKIINGHFIFDLQTPYLLIHDVRTGYPGRVNLENMVGAAAAAMLAGADPMEVKKAVLGYKGVVRRFDVRFRNDKVVYIDDYAHHPGELDATIQSVRELYGGKKILGVFQPHLYSRTRDFYKGFAKSLDQLDEAILLDIYPARETPLEGVSSTMIFNEMKLENRTLCSMDQLLKVLGKSHYDVLLTMGAGNIDHMVEPLVQMLNHKFEKK